MSEEMHLFVIWSKGRFREKRILEDIRNRFEVVHVCELAFPGRACDGYCQFYHTRRFNVRKKVSRCGKGPFLLVVVKVKDVRETIDRYGKKVNALMYERKDVYREWCKGKYRVHGTLLTKEFERDVYLLTGHTAEEWAGGVPSDIHLELPPLDSIPPPVRKDRWYFRLLKRLLLFRREG